jgi:hypothetical protein
VTAAHQVADLALDLGPGGPVVSPPGRVCLADAGGGQPGLVRADGDRAAFFGGGALGGQWADAAGCGEPGSPGMAPGGGPDGHGDAGRAGDRLAAQVDGEAVLGEAAFDRGRRLAFDAVIDTGAVQPSDELAGAVGGIAVDSRLAFARRGPPAVLAGGAFLITGEQVSEQALGDLGVPAVSRRGLRGGDDLRVRVDRDVPLVAVEAARGGLVSVCLFPPGEGPCPAAAQGRDPAAARARPGAAGGG